MLYRGLTLSCTMFKMYCLILNDRWSEWAESNDILNNGFRKNCISYQFFSNYFIEKKEIETVHLLCLYRFL